MSTTNKSVTKKRKDIWMPNERHYCKECNSWMASDRQSILLHENGRGHQYKVQNNLKQRKYDEDMQGREQEKLQSSLREIEKVAAYTHIANDSKIFGSVAAVAAASMKPAGSNTSKYYNSNNLYCQVAGASAASSQNNNTDDNKNSATWRQDLRQKREATTTQDALTENDASKNQQHPMRRKTLGKDEGHYTIGETIYLDCSIYAALLNVDMPAQLWTGVSSIEGIKRAEKNTHEWKTGLVVKLNQIPCHNYNSNNNNSNNQQTNDQNNNNTTATELRINFAYLKHPDDEEETLENNVKPSRIRIIIGDDEESGIPNTIQEARLQLLGGEEEIILENNKNGTTTSSNNNTDTKAIIDENTGFSSWDTISIKNTTKEKEAQTLVKQHKRQKEEEEELKVLSKQDAYYKKMEEAKYVSKDDSALGAYDVFSSQTKGYKGIDIFDDDNNIEEKGSSSNISSNKKRHVFDHVPSLSSNTSSTMAKKNHNGFKNVGFLKKKKKMKQNIRKRNVNDD